MKGFVLAGTRSGIGKTTISMGLMSILEDVSPFKVGPDYIDPTFHRFITGNKSYNLDLFLMGESGVRYSFFKHQRNMSIVEGVMGLYDGLGNELDNYSTAHLSRVLNLPVVLVVDAIGKSTSIVAEILGYKKLDERVNIVGVIINRVSSEKLYLMLKEGIEKYTKIKCLGYLKKDVRLNINSRHLGLLQADEITDLNEKKSVLIDEMKKTIDIELLKKLVTINGKKDSSDIFKEVENRYNGMKIGVARDRAFSFYYEDNLELLEKMGMKIVEFSPLEDKTVPDVDILYFGGGYPENNLEQLSKNIEFKNSLHRFHNKGGVILGECGGFMYLSYGITDLNGKFYEMSNLTDCSVKMKKTLLIKRFGYAKLYYNSIEGRVHEFHYSDIDNIGTDEKVFEVKKMDGRTWRCGYKNKNMIAGYPHLHFFKNLEILKEILKGVKR